MRRIVKSMFTKRSRAKRNQYFDAGFKSYENTFEDARACHCTLRDIKRKENNAKKGGMFE